jgi:exosortase H (IPTLxxWG-CTERM-specific)
MLAGPKSKDRIAWRFAIVFFLLVISLSLMLEIPWIQQNVVLPYTATVAHLCAVLLAPMIQGVEVTQTIIRSSPFTVDIRRGCDGVVASIILASAFVAYPMAWRRRIWGMLLGFLLVQILNLVRIVGLFLLKTSGSEQIFDFFHTYVSQFVVIALVMVFWIYWIGRARTISL